MPTNSGLIRTNAQHRASAAATTTHNTVGETTGSNELIAVMLDITAVSGTTPTMDVEVQWSHDNATWFSDDAGLDRFAQKTVASKVVKQFVVKGAYFRLAVVVGGTTPSFTYSARTYKGYVAP